MNESDEISLLVNGEAVRIRKSATILDLLQQLNIRTRGIAVELNQEIQPSNQFGIRTLKSNDSLEIVTLVGGG